jgi:hypothetical protein
LGWERRLRAWGSCPTHSGGLGLPSGPITGVCHCELAGRGQASGEKNAVLKDLFKGSAKSPEERSEVLKNAVTERRKALPWPLFSGDPGNKLRSLHYKVRLSALRLPLVSRARSSETPIHAKYFAGSDDAWPGRRSSKMCGRAIYTVSYAGLTRVSIHLHNSASKNDGLPGQARQ